MAGGIKRRLGLGAVAAILGAVPTGAQDGVPGFNLYGGTGLIDMPTAETPPDGQLTWNYSRMAGTTRSGISAQLLPRVQGTVRYSTIDNFGVADVSASDRSFDLQFQLLQENGWMPGVALGFRDFLGTSPYGAEYLVATKTVTDDIKVSAGIGWGRLGSNNGFSNPLGLGDRPPVTEPSGQVQTERFFRGDAALFGGVEWNTPIEGLSLKAEVSSDAYAGETQNGAFENKTPFNIGATYRWNESVHVSGYYLHGDTVGFQIALTGNPNKPLAPQDLGAGPVPVNARADDAPRGTGWASSAANRELLIKGISEVLSPEGIVIREAKLTGTVADIFINNSRITREPKAIGRTARVLALGLPPSVEVFRITVMQGDLSVTTAEIRRSDLEAQVDRPDAGMESWQTTKLTDAVAHLEGDDVWVRQQGARFSWSLNPRVPFSLFDPDEPIRPDVQLALRAGYDLGSGLSIGTEISHWVVGTAEKTVSTSTSPLPHVRSDAGLYYGGHKPTLNRLTADYVFKLTPSTYARVSGGILERMFSGISTEVLWQPVAQSWGLGAELNYVKQRDPKDVFALIDYEILTGHASLYWDTGYYGLEAQVDAGRYLAGDWGATFTLSRRFANGWEMSAFFTRTDVSYEDFGSGSFANGVSLTMPLRWGLPYETKSTAGVDLGSVSRDGGSRLRVGGRLHNRVRDLDSVSLNRSWGAYWQ